MKTKLKLILGRTDDVFRNYSFVLLSALVAGIAMVSLIYVENTVTEDAKYNLSKLAFTGTLGISLLFALNILSERIGKKLLLNIAGVGFLILYYLFVFPKSDKDFTEIYAPIIIVSYILTHLLVAFIAFFKKNNEVSFWQFNKNLFINIVLTAIFTGVLVGGILLAIAAIDNLFDFEFNKKIYPETFFFLAIVGSCFIFLLFNEDGLKFLEKDSSYPEILKFFVQFVLIPLLFVYSIIFYLYFGKIVLKWNLPRGWVSYLILAYSIVGILAILLVYPLKELSTKTWVKAFSKIFYYTLIPLIVLLFIAIKTRILAYGFTENRYYVLLLAIWLTVVVLYFIFKKKPSIKFIPISLFVFGVFSLLIPYFNAFSVSKRSQKTELQDILTKNNLLENGKINFAKPVQDSVVVEVSNKFEYLNNRKESELLLNYIPKNSQKKFDSIFKKDRYLVNSEVRNQFKNILNKNYLHADYTLSFNTKDNLINLKNYEYLINYDIDKRNDKNDLISTFKDEKYNLEFDKESNIITLSTYTKTSQKYDLKPFLQKLFEKYKNENGLMDLEFIEFDLHNFHFKIYINNFNYQKLNDSEVKFTVLKATVLIK